MVVKTKMNDNKRNFDKYGNVYFTESDIIEILYSGDTNINGFPVIESEEINTYNKNCFYYDKSEKTLSILENVDLSIEEFDQQMYNNWFIPKYYKELDLNTFLLNKCSNNTEIKRVEHELEYFYSYNLENILRFMIFFIDELRKNNQVWGVGRGSSVASFILYLVGVHKINPIKYNIKSEEFFK